MKTIGRHQILHFVNVLKFGDIFMALTEVIYVHLLCLSIFCPRGE